MKKRFQRRKSVIKSETLNEKNYIYIYICIYTFPIFEVAVSGSPASFSLLSKSRTVSEVRFLSKQPMSMQPRSMAVCLLEIAETQSPKIRQIEEDDKLNNEKCKKICDRIRESLVRKKNCFGDFG